MTGLGVGAKQASSPALLSLFWIQSLYSAQLAVSESGCGASVLTCQSCEQAVLTGGAAPVARHQTKDGVGVGARQEGGAEVALAADVRLAAELARPCTTLPRPHQAGGGLGQAGGQGACHVSKHRSG